VGRANACLSRTSPMSSNVHKPTGRWRYGLPPTAEKMDTLPSRHAAQLLHANTAGWNSALCAPFASLDIHSL